LQAEHDKLQRRLDTMYIDKLDGRVDNATFDRLAEQWRAEQDRLLRSIDKHREATEVYFAEGAKILELASRCQDLFARQPSQEKRKLLEFVLSNCSWSHGELTPTFRQPFDLLVDTRKTAIQHERAMAGLGASGSKCDIWYPQRDSNPRSPP
jgi:site-specific DNA recombinase